MPNREAAPRTAGEDGDGGLEAVARRLALLSVEGFHLLRNRQLPTTGSVLEYALIGANGVLLVRSKTWKVQPSVRNGRLSAGRYDQHQSVERSLEERAEVEEVLQRSGVSLPVHSALLFLAGKGSAPKDAAGVLLWGPEDLEGIQGALGGRPTSWQDTALAALLAATSSAGATPPAPDLTFNASPSEVEALQGRFSVFHIRESRSPHTLHLYGAEGAEVGSKNLTTGVTLASKDAGSFSQAILQGVASRDPSQIALPQVPAGTRLTGRLLRYLTSTHREVLLGWEWKHRGEHRLYVHHLRHAQPSIELGYANVRTGTVHAQDYPTPEDKGEHERLIRYAHSLSPFQ